MFHQYGDRYYLFGMRLDDSGTIFKLPESKAERELQAQNLPAAKSQKGSGPRRSPNPSRILSEVIPL